MSHRRRSEGKCESEVEHWSLIKLASEVRNWNIYKMKKSIIFFQYISVRYEREYEIQKI